MNTEHIFQPARKQSPASTVPNTNTHISQVYTRELMRTSSMETEGPGYIRPPLFLQSPHMTPASQQRDNEGGLPPNVFILLGTHLIFLAPNKLLFRDWFLLITFLKLTLSDCWRTVALPAAELYSRCATCCNTVRAATQHAVFKARSAWLPVQNVLLYRCLMSSNSQILQSNLLRKCSNKNIF